MRFMTESISRSYTLFIELAPAAPMRHRRAWRAMSPTPVVRERRHHRRNGGDEQQFDDPGLRKRHIGTKPPGTYRSLRLDVRAGHHCRLPWQPLSGQAWAASSMDTPPLGHRRPGVTSGRWTGMPTARGQQTLTIGFWTSGKRVSSHVSGSIVRFRTIGVLRTTGGAGVGSALSHQLGHDGQVSDFVMTPPTGCFAASSPCHPQ